MYDAILFDLDGTIIDSEVGITRSVQYALDAFGIKVDDPRTLVHFVGPPLHLSFQKYYHFDEAAAREAVEKYRELREGDERFVDTYRRVGMDPFKEAIYG